MSQSTAVLCLYAGVAFLASLTGGSLSSLVRLTHTRLQTALSFEVRAASVLDGATAVLTNVAGITTNGPATTVNVRDSQPSEQTSHRFYQLRVTLYDP